MSLSLALRIKVYEQEKATGAIRSFAGSMDVVSNSAQKATQNLRGTSDAAQLVGVQARQARAFSNSVTEAGSAASMAERNVRAMTQASNEGLSEGASRAKEFGSAIARAGKEGIESWTGMKLSISGVVGKIKEARESLEGLRKKVAIGMGAGGLATGATLGGMTMAAGQVQMVQSGLKTNLRGSNTTVDEMMEEIKKFDADSQLDFLESTKTANRLIARGFSPDETIPMMRLMGDAVGAQGGGQEEFGRMALAISQIKARGGGKYSAEEGNQLADLGINATRIISKATGVSESDIASGEHEVTGDQALKAILDGLKQFEGGMEAAAQTLPGKLSTLQGAFFQLQASVGQHFLPAVTGVVGVITSAVDAFNRLPEPIHKIIAYTAAFNAGLLILGGLLLGFAGPIGGVITAFKILTWTIPVVNKSIAQLTWSLLKHLIPGLGATTAAASTMMLALGAMALAVITAAAIIKGIEWYNDAKTKSDAEMEMDGPVEGQIAKAGRYYGDNSHIVSEEDKKLYEHYKRTQEKYGRPVKSLKEWKGNSTASDEASGDTPEQIRAAKEAEEKRKLQGQFGSQIAMLQSGDIAAATPSISTITGVANVTGNGDIAAQEDAINAMESEMDALRAQLRKATGKENADLRKTLQERIAQKAIQMREARQALAADKRSTSADKREREKAEKQAIDDEQTRYEVQEADIEESFNTRIAGLEAQRDAAREAKNEAREAQLKFEIEKLQAERDYALAKIRAAQTGLEDDVKADTMLRVAEKRRKGALLRAQIALNAARNKGLDFNALLRGAPLPGLPPGLATRAAESAAMAESGGMFGMRSGNYGDSDAMTRMITSPERPANMNSLAANTRAKARDWVVKAKGKTERTPGGLLRILFEEIKIEDVAAKIGSRLP